IQTLREAIQKEDVSAIHAASESLQNATYALTQQMYAQDNSANGGAASPQGGHEAPEGDVVEGEFTEV
ncbi:MAG: molecular chaperone DnaK, partial [Anaerolineae bacterium]|nr:molecular chaperone DnaK [Anaerolineae bacterium]